MSQVGAQGVEFHSVAGESCCAGVQVLYFTRALIYVRPHTHVAVSCKPKRKATVENGISQSAVPQTACKIII